MVREAPLMEHLEELRSRILWSLLVWGIATAVAFNFRTQLIDLLRRPLDAYNATAKVPANLQLLNITDAFTVSLQVAAFGGLAISLPFIVYQIWAFIAPGLYGHERRLAVPFMLGAGFSFALGAAFAYLVILPFAVPFLLGFLGGAVVFNIALGNYMNQVLTIMGVMGLLFEMPVVSYLFARLGFLSSQFLISNWRIAIVGLVTLAAVITPTVDIVNLSLVSLPLLVLYWVSILLVRIAERSRAKEAGPSAA